MVKQTTITVITPSFQQGEFIGETIKSVLMQQGDFYIDYIIVDGRSTDSTIDTITKYEEHLKSDSISSEIDGLTFHKEKTADSQFIKCSGISYRWISEPDNGQVDALKKGFSLAVGNIFCWLNSDDIFTGQDTLDIVTRHFRSDPDIKLLTADGLLINKAGESFGTWHVDKLNFRELLFLDYSILQPSTFFAKEIYRREYLNEKYTCAFDADFFIHLIHDGVRMKKTDDLLSAFRIYPEIKTLHLSKRRFFESVLISTTYSKNLFYILISIFFKYFSILLKPKYEGRENLFDKVYPAIYKTSYKLITGKPGR